MTQRTIMDQMVQMECFVKSQSEEHDNFETKETMTMGDVVNSFIGIAFETMPDVSRFKSKMFKDGVYRLTVLDDEGECKLFLKTEIK